MKPNLKELAVFSVLGCVMFASKIAMDALPNMHLLGVLIVAFTLTFRAKALYPIYVYVFLLGAIYGFSPWWIPNLYVWTVLWAWVMLLPKKLPKPILMVLAIVLCGLHGFLFGVLYAPAQALLFGLNFDGMIAWIVAGFPFDLIHGVSNLLLGGVIPPLVRAMTAGKKYLT
ncbi:MAG: hypothetical protein IKT68_01055 [Clostridia bacterium]|nr:hypothetical protein [Clostridia bacterium]